MDCQDHERGAENSSWPHTGMVVNNMPRCRTSFDKLGTPFGTIPAFISANKHVPHHSQGKTNRPTKQALTLVLRPRKSHQFKIHSRIHTKTNKTIFIFPTAFLQLNTWSILYLAPVGKAGSIFCHRKYYIFFFTEHPQKHTVLPNAYSKIEYWAN